MTSQVVCSESTDISRRPDLIPVIYSINDLCTVIWQCTDEALASQTMLICVAHSGSPHIALRYTSFIVQTSLHVFLQTDITCVWL